MCPVHLPALWIFLLLILPGRTEAQGPVRAMSAQQALQEMNGLIQTHPEAKAFYEAAKGAYPLAWVHERPTVGSLVSSMT